MSRLTKYEQETIINYNRGDEYCSIATFDPVLIKRMYMNSTLLRNI